jgi:hypothetical protein
MKEDLSLLQLNFVVDKERKIWVAMSVSTLVTTEGRILVCIQGKLLVSYVLIWDRDRPIAGSTLMLQ